MPFDGVDLDQPCLRTLSAVLRDQTKWPAGFRWNYAHPSHCALGLGRELWGWSAFKHITRSIPHRDENTIFFELGINVRPEHVADAIDAYLATGAVDPVPPQYRAQRMVRDWFRRWFPHRATAQ
jgi:hypothetical protein